MTEMVEKALLIAGRGDGPWCPVRGLEHIEVEGMSSEDILVLESRSETLLTIQQNGVHSVNVEEGDVRVLRANGTESRITVRAFGAW